MRYLYAGLLGCLCSSLAWAAVDDAPAKNKTQQHAHVQKMAKANAKAAPKLSPAELANLATQNEMAQRRAAFAASAAGATPATVSTTATPMPTAAAPQATAPALTALVPATKPAPVAPIPATALAAPATMPVAQAAVNGDVHLGRMVCELGNAVSVTPDAGQPGSYWVQMRQHRFHMTPVTTTTGAVRLEDSHAGAMWLQLPHKSMLMNSKLGQRMADECQSANQLEVATRMKSGPPSTLLDGPSFAKK
jgi:hypothetical protein